jgi:RimJ/RimL family protein N-acetyltransferase
VAAIAGRFSPPADPRPDDIAWPRLTWPPPADVELVGDVVRLRPAVPARDAAQLFSALDDDRVWTHLAGRPADAQGWAAALADRTAATWCTWTVRLREPAFGLPTDAVVGTSSYLEVAPDDARLEIGATAYAPAVWASRVNPETKLLLLGYAFDELGAGRVQLKTDIRNVRSAQAIARLGAHFEGTLRRYQRRSDDTVRDTVLFSITAEDWPEVRQGLLARLAAPGLR